MTSDFSKSTKQELINYLLDFYLEYRDKVTFSPEITFGVEVEVLTKRLLSPATVCDYMVSAYSKNKKPSDYVIASENYDDRVIGGELISPILTNTEKDWQFLKQAINDFVLYTGDATITFHTAGHIHLGHNTLKAGDLVKLVKLYAAFEPIIFRFSAGEFLNVRAGATSYAKPIAKKVKNFTGTSDEEIISRLCLDGNIGTSTIPFKYNGLNLSNLVCGNDTLEFRTPNGTLSLPIWQNNVNFFAHLLMAVDNYDEELIDYYLSNLSLPFSDREVVKEYNEVFDFDKALELADIVFTDELDKLYFLRQYLKDGSLAKEEIISGYQLEKSLPFVR